MRWRARAHANVGRHSVPESDVPSPIDLRDPADARAWESSAQSRPGRTEMFQAFASQLNCLGVSALRVLELGSGPGFLADFLLRAMPHLELTLLDFSPPMHDLARVRLKDRLSSVHFLSLSFRSPGWVHGLGPFDAIVTNQAVHELRHKRYAPILHAEVAGLLSPGGSYLVCDHFCGEGGMSNNQLYMSVEEQRQALLNAGFKVVDQINKVGSLVMHRAAQQSHAASRDT
jgi:SAM-dependent methyltransferase